jgi:hypothetical protein
MKAFDPVGAASPLALLYSEREHAFERRARATPDEAAALAKLVRQIGLKRFVMGSDYDSFTPKSTDDLTRAKLPLSNREWRVVARNCKFDVRYQSYRRYFFHKFKKAARFTTVGNLAALPLGPAVG